MTEVETLCMVLSCSFIQAVKLRYYVHTIHYLEKRDRSTDSTCGTVLLVYSGCESLTLGSTVVHYLEQRFSTFFNSLHTVQGAKIVKAQHRFLRRVISLKRRLLKLCLKVQ
jgi:FtsH-binding integral membrane protein